MTTKEKKSNWVDFSAIKQNISFLTILEHYNLLAEFKKKSDKLTGPCPIHKGDSKTAFHIDLNKNAYKCFTRCKSKGFKGGGNIIDFVAEMEHLGVLREGIKKAAHFILEWTGHEAKGGSQVEKSRPEKPGEPEENKPLAFSYKYIRRTGILKSGGLLQKRFSILDLAMLAGGSWEAGVVFQFMTTKATWLHMPAGPLTKSWPKRRGNISFQPIF
jgi:hypothetical protein